MRYLSLLAFGTAVLLASVQAVPEPVIADPPPTSSSVENKLSGLPPVPIPANNPQTTAKIELGDKLFHDKRFSVDGTVSCANCHNESQAFTDGLPVSVGHHGLTGTRNAPTVLNAAFNQIAILGRA
jgi:cytochrome c peroxidase